MNLNRYFRSQRIWKSFLLIIVVCLFLFMIIEMKGNGSEKEVLDYLEDFIEREKWRVENASSRAERHDVKVKENKSKKKVHEVKRIKYGQNSPSIASKFTAAEKRTNSKFTATDSHKLFTTDNSEEIKNCQDYKEDRPNWTIEYRKDNIARKCLKRAYRPKWVKRFVFANKTIIYNGCTRQSRKCREMPHFDSKIKKRINTPPCCLKHVVQILGDFAELMQKFGGRYFLFGGGLIGWYRNRSMVPYDHDIDVIVALGFWKSNRFKLLLNEMKKRKGYSINRLNWNKIKIYYSKTNHNFIDLWPFSRKGKDKIRINSTMWKAHNVSNVLPLKKSNFEGFPIWVPNDPAAMLTTEYGKGWPNELTCKRIGKFGNCVK